MLHHCLSRQDSLYEVKILKVLLRSQSPERVKRVEENPAGGNFARTSSHETIDRMLKE